MKYYFPTTTLNFNNILSSESISPADFYPARGFGYRRWEVLDEHQARAFIVLYDELRYFERPESDQEDHPLLVEMELEDGFEVERIPSGEKIYLCWKTIYLSPANTTFIFFSEQDRRVAWSLSLHSLETKLVRLYQERLKVLDCRPTERYSFPFPIRIPEEKKDFRVDRLKGLLYGYYVGGLLSSSISRVREINQLREIENVFSAIQSNIGGGATGSQIGQLKRLNTKIDYEPYLKELTNNKNAPEENKAILWIKEQIKACQSQMDNERSEHAIKPESKELVVSNYRVSFISPDRIPDEKERKLFTVWVEKVFCSPQFDGKISTNREALSDRLTMAALQFVYVNDEQNPAIVFLEKLRRHVRGNAFDAAWKNGLLSSVAAVLVAGEDWTKLLRYMQGKEMTDYALAFTMFGCLNGFAALPRDFTDVLYDQEPHYVSAVYEEFYRQLFGKQINVEISVRQAAGVSLRSSPVSSSASAMGGNESVRENVLEESLRQIGGTTKQEQGIRCSEETFMEKLTGIKVGSKDLNVEQKSELLKLYKEGQPSLDEFFMGKKKIKGIGKKTLKTFRDVFGVSTSISKEKQAPCHVAKQLELQMTVENDDDGFIRGLECVRTCECAEQQIKRLIENFIYTKKNSKDKEDHIQHFINLCEKEGRGEIKGYYALKDFFTPEIGDIFRKEIEAKYGQHYHE